ncbi:MAG: bifunctional phosphoribosyl-AMP cyclohydrolase/phosphoribosyl-ATP diphosphatase HisIE [Christensenella sp.]|uniref:bifunctional phosphoribosyl-AMP cyclohydrolase/phosphoribosyl-ATP diphosphatase HisIE n=1 Tax=Christensenella sp. TaxID=1935934 RepID=UPI002B214773|nr:bifunctional phosphoribosyl-AMP cyclohydrolase/phosphoribosyl-ATP diphosphatase HisIE [Christensenella sp.]MEA5002197.1 bifunctional phosphoribosyl-AMP cyclohydrolase/phosphoribosyl-ATP diphosphatase HisIE [Christensenella sp.]
MDMEIKFGQDGLVPAIAQEADTGVVLMQAYMNKEAFDKTLETGYAHYYSRSRQQLWKKGETSGNVQKIVSVSLDCDGDCVLLQVKQTGVACHTGKYSCFFNQVQDSKEAANSSLLYELYDLIADRKINPKEGSYTNYLFEKGIDKILKKVGEESAEVIIASKNPGTDELRYEAADLLYHLLVLMNEKGLTLPELFAELQNRR